MTGVCVEGAKEGLGGLCVTLGRFIAPGSTDECATDIPVEPEATVGRTVGRFKVVPTGRAGGRTTGTGTPVALGTDGRTVGRLGVPLAGTFELG